MRITKLSKCLTVFGLAGTLMFLSGIILGGSAERGFHPQPVMTDPIVGTWECTVPPGDGFPEVRVIKDIHAGGTVLEIDNAAPPSQETPTVGDWKRTGSLTYLAKLRQMTFDASGNFIGTFHYTNPLTISPSLNSMQGTFDYTLVDPNGNVIASGGGTVSCSRLSHVNED